MDESVIFSVVLSPRGQIFISEKNVKVTKESVFISPNYKEKKAWYNQECKIKREKVQEALKNYNSSKNTDTRKTVPDRKKDYKYF